MNTRVSRPFPPSASGEFLRRSLTVVFTFAVVASLRSAATLKGFIVENELAGRPVSGIQVSASGANADSSKADGRFQLQFPSRNPGQVTRLIVDAGDRVVVNDIQLRVTLPADPDAEALPVILSAPAAREEMAKRYYRLRSWEAVEAAYLNRIAALETQGQADAERLGALRQERDAARAASENAAEELARLKPGDTSDLHDRALVLFLAGKPEAALALLGDATLERQAREAREALEKTVESFLLRARILTTQFRFDEAASTYRRATNAAPQSFSAHHAAGLFHQELRRFPEARPSYENALAIARQSGTPAEVAMTLNNLGNLHGVENRRREALRAYEEALKIRRQLAATNPDAYLPDVATTLNNLGIHFALDGDLASAKSVVGESRDIYFRFAQSHPAAFGPKLERAEELLKLVGQLEAGQSDAPQSTPEEADPN